MGRYNELFSEQRGVSMIKNEKQLSSGGIVYRINENGIEVVEKNLGGNNPNTAKHYGNKNTKEIIDAYNPPHIIPKYADQVLSIMDAIEDNISLTIKATELSNS